MPILKYSFGSVYGTVIPLVCLLFTKIGLIEGNRNAIIRSWKRTNFIIIEENVYFNFLVYLIMAAINN